MAVPEMVSQNRYTCMHASITLFVHSMSAGNKEGDNREEIENSKEGGLDIDQEEEYNVVQWPTQAELMMVIAEQKVVCHAL